MSRASDVGHDRTLYRGRATPSGEIDWDQYFAPFERMAHGPVNRIVGSKTAWVPAESWARLTGYLSALTSKMPDMEWELDNWVQTSEWTRENVDVGYALNMQRVSAAFVRARWMLFRDPKQRLIINDRGGAARYFPEWEAPGYVFPLRKGLAAALGPGPYRKKMRWDGSGWSIHIPVVDIDDSLAGVLNDTAIIGAAKMVYGPDLKLFQRIQPSVRSIPDELRQRHRLDSAGRYLGLTTSERIDDELLLFHLIGSMTPGTAVGEEVFI